MKLVPAFIAFAAALTAPAAAQEAPAAQPTPDQLQAAANHYALIAGAIQSEELPQEVRNQLFLCLYSAPVRQISENVTAVIAQNEQLTADNPEHVQAAIGLVCGVQRPEQPAE